MDIKLAQGSVAAFAGAAGGIRNDVTGNAEAIWLCGPAQGDHYVRRIARIRVDGFQRESAFELLARKNHPGKIGMLEPFDQPGCDRPIVLDDVKENRPAISDDHDLSGFRRLLKCGPASNPRRATRGKIDAAPIVEKPWSETTRTVRCLARIFLRTGLENGGEIAVRAPGWAPGNVRNRVNIRAASIGIAQPKKRKGGKTVRATNLGGRGWRRRCAVVGAGWLGQKGTEKAQRFFPHAARHWRSGEFRQRTSRGRGCPFGMTVVEKGDRFGAGERRAPAGAAHDFRDGGQCEILAAADLVFFPHDVQFGVFKRSLRIEARAVFAVREQTVAVGIGACRDGGAVDVGRRRIDRVMTTKGHAIASELPERGSMRSLM